MEGLRIDHQKNRNINRELWTTVVPNLVNLGFVIDLKNIFKTYEIDTAAMGFQDFRKARLGTWMTQIVCSKIHERRPPDSKFKTTSTNHI